jgi:hypothetical protein
MTVSAYNQAARQAQAEFGSNDMDDALARLIDIEHLDAAGRCLGPQRRQQFLSNLDCAGPTARRGNGVIRRREGQFGIMDLEASTLEIEQAAGPSEIMQQMAVDMKKIRILAYSGDDVLVPNLGQDCSARLTQGSPPFGF